MFADRPIRSAARGVKSREGGCIGLPSKYTSAKRPWRDGKPEVSAGFDAKAAGAFFTN